MRYYIIGTAGHVDHGKTALVGALTGMDTDRLAEEKKRGLSIELGFAYCEGPGGDTMAFIDVPGHERFIRAMLSGVSSIDLALFCVAADDGIMPQSREHLDILHLLGVRRAVFVITKVDLATAKRVAEVRTEIEALIKGTSLEGALIVEVSVHKQQGVEALKEILNNELAIAPVRQSGGLLRLPIDRVFSVKGHGAVVTGTVVSGSIKVGDELALFGGDKRQFMNLRVRGIESHNKKVEVAARGQRAAVNLTGLSHNEIARGSVLVPAGFSGAAVTKFDCVVELAAGAGVIIKDRARLKLYHQASQRDVTFQIKGGAKAAVGGTKAAVGGANSAVGGADSGKLAADSGKGGRLYGRMHLTEPLLALRGDAFILRDPALRRTVGGGRVLMPYPSKALTPALKGLDMAALAGGDLTQQIIKMVRRSGYYLQRRQLAAVLNLEVRDLSSLVESSGEIGFFKENIVVTEDMLIVEKAVLEAVAAYHAEHSAETGMRPENCKGAAEEVIGHGPWLAILDGLLDDGLISDMVDRGLLRRSGPFIALPSFRTELVGLDKELDTALMVFFTAGIKSASMADMKELPFDNKEIDRAIVAIIERGDAVKLKDKVYLGGAALGRARELLEGHIKAHGSIKVADMRDLLGCGRRLAIEILDYFDKERITLRKGDERILR